MLVKYAFLFCGVVAPSLASVVQRDSSPAFQNDFSAIDAGVKKITTDINSVSNPETGAQTLTIVNDFSNIISKTKQGTTDCNTIPNNGLTAAQTQQIINYCNSVLEPDYRAFANAAVNKKVALMNGNGFYKIQSKWLQGNTTLLENCLLTKIPATPTTLKPAATSCLNRLNSDLTTIVTTFGN